MSEYLIINIVVILVPALLTFEKKLQFYKKLPAVIPSILIVAIVYIVWDVLATARGDWSFNELYLLGINLFGLPLEELLFFFTIPYAIIFLFETANLYLNDKPVNPDQRIIYSLSIVLIVLAGVFYNQDYTMTVLIFTGVFLALGAFMNTPLFNSRLYWLFILFTFIPFLVVNYFLTSLPIVSYNNSAIWGVRFITIPLEDFFYSFSLLSFNLLVYTYAKEKWLIKE